MSSFQQDPICVLKFGSSVLRSEADLPAAVHSIYAEFRLGKRVLVVASALGSTTDDLLAQAQAISPKPSPRELAKLLATGESASAALLSLALKRAGVRSRLIGPEEIGLVAEGGHLDAHPVALDSEAIRREFELAPVLVLPGFIARRPDGDLALFGRGGSDLTAIFVAGKLQQELGETRCVLVKDVQGLFEWDPARVTEGPPRRYAQCSYADALQLSGAVVQHKAIRLARESGLSFEVGSASTLGSDPATADAEALQPTRVGPASSILSARSPIRYTRLRVGLAGHGTVGSGVLQHLLDSSDDFDVSGVLVRNLQKHRLLLEESGDYDPEQFDRLFTDDVEQFFNRPLDVFVELIGGEQPASEWIERAFDAGLDVVSANKALIAKHGKRLQTQADGRRCLFHYSAAVGGSTPLLEAAKRLQGQGVRGFEGVLNGTTNFILDALAGGTSLQDAIRQAQELGYAEADPSLDLDGTDARQKAELIARELYGSEVLLRWGEQVGVAEIPHKLFGEANAAQGVVRLVASCYLEQDSEDQAGPPRVSLQVGPVVLPASHPLSRISGAGGGAVFDLGGPGWARVFLEGEAAGRWPTAEAVLADLFELRRSAGCRGAQSSTKR